MNVKRPVSHEEQQKKFESFRQIVCDADDMTHLLQSVKRLDDSV